MLYATVIVYSLFLNATLRCAAHVKFGCISAICIPLQPEKSQKKSWQNHRCCFTRVFGNDCSR